MNILFLGYTIRNEEASGLLGASVAGNKMQLNVLSCLSKYQDLRLNCITAYPTAAYPIGKIIIHSEIISLSDALVSLKIGFVNLPIMKQLNEIIGIYRQAKKLVKSQSIKIIFTFNMFPELGLPAIWLKKRYGCEIVSLLADLPIDDTIDRKGVSVLFRKIFDKLTEKAILQCNKIIVLNKNAANRYAPQLPYLVVEGGVDRNDISGEDHLKGNKKDLVYSGALVAYSGIINLIHAMKYVTDQDVMLHIYGDGQIRKQVISCAAMLPNVTYHGKIDNISMKKIQREAYLLINPRPTDNPISKVTFPSKIFEYMVSGTPVLTTRLDGFTEDYNNTMFFVERSDVMSLANKINEILTLSEHELTEKAFIARQFIIQNKTWETQCKRIYEFIKGES